MKLQRNDYLIISFLLSLTFLFSFLAYHIFNQEVTRSSTGEPIGQVSYKYNYVFRKYTNRFIWEKINPRTPIYLHDSILTKDKSDATIILNSGTEIDLSADSLIQIDFDDDKISLNLKQGTIHSKGNALIKTDSGLVANLGNSETTISQTKDGRTGLLVRKGNVKLQGSDGKYSSISSGQILDIRNNKWVVKKIEIKKLSPSNNTLLLTDTYSKSITLKWEKNKEVVYYDILLSRNHSMKGARVIKVSTNQYRTVLKSGEWYWQVIGHTRDKKQKISAMNAINIQVDKQVEVVFPRHKSILLTKASEPVFFKWNVSSAGGSSPNIFRLQIARDKKFKRLVKNELVEGSSYSISGLSKGLYYWKVRPEYRNKGKIIEQKSNKNKEKQNVFVVEDSITKIFAPDSLLPNGTIKCQAGVDKEVRLRWKAVSKTSYYVIKIYLNQKEKPDNEIKLKSNSMLFKVPWDVKYVYWEVTASVNYGSKGGFILTSDPASALIKVNLTVPPSPVVFSAVSNTLE